MTDRAALIDKIKALRSRTIDRGCTEAEAKAAAAKAAQLMREARLTDDDLVMGEAAVETGVKQRAKAARLFGVIAYMTNCKAVELSTGRVLFVGLEPGPEIAEYLLDVCETALRVETDAFKRGTFYRSRRKIRTRRQAIADFQVALIERLAIRLYELFQDTLSDADREAATKAVARRMNTVTVTRSSHKTRYSEAAWHGHKAGDGVGLHHGVKTGQGDVRRIGGAV